MRAIYKSAVLVGCIGAAVTETKEKRTVQTEYCGFACSNCTTGWVPRGKIIPNYNSYECWACKEGYALDKRYEKCREIMCDPGCIDCEKSDSLGIATCKNCESGYYPHNRTDSDARLAYETLLPLYSTGEYKRPQHLQPLIMQPTDTDFTESVCRASYSTPEPKEDSMGHLGPDTNKLVPAEKDQAWVVFVIIAVLFVCIVIGVRYAMHYWQNRAAQRGTTGEEANLNRDRQADEVPKYTNGNPSQADRGVTETNMTTTTATPPPAYSP